MLTCQGRYGSIVWDCRLVVFLARLRSKGSDFTLGLWGVGVEGVFAIDSAQPFATLRNRSREGLLSVLMGTAAKKCYFWRFQMSRGFVSLGRLGTS